jgi:hypothetical protein
VVRDIDQRAADAGMVYVPLAQEVGIRLALGAHTTEIAGLVLRGGIRQLSLGSWSGSRSPWWSLHCRERH